MSNIPPEPDTSFDQSNIIPPPSIATDGEWSFSFKYFNQIDYFGLKSGKIKNTWLVSLLERFRELNKMKLSNINYYKNRKGLHYHAIDWEATNIPISREDFTWIDESIRQNETEFPFMQFHISKALGRVIGFWYETVFYVLLLDPLHNMQPSSDFNYKVDPCSPLSCEITNLLKRLDIIQRKIGSDKDFNISKELDKLSKDYYPYSARLIYLSDDYLKELESKLDSKSLTDIIELGLLRDGD